MLSFFFLSTLFRLYLKHTYSSVFPSSFPPILLSYLPVCLLTYFVTHIHTTHSTLYQYNTSDLTLHNITTTTLLGWLPQHREAINQSDELRGVEDLTRSTVLYHNNKEKVISADVLSVSTSQQADMMTYLSSLKPTQVDWTIPYQHISDYDIQRWNEIQKKFAIRVNAKWKEMPHRADPDWAMQQRTKKELRVWAFNNFADIALQYISATRYQAYPSGGSVDSNSDSDMQDSMEKSPVDFDMKGGMQGLGAAWVNASHMQTLSRSQVAPTLSLTTSTSVIMILSLTMTVTTLNLFAFSRVFLPSLSRLFSFFPTSFYTVILF